MELLHGGVVGVLVRDEEGSLGLTPVGVQPILLQNENYFSKIKFVTRANRTNPARRFRPTNPGVQF